jgi:hypothetical protein
MRPSAFDPPAIPAAFWERPDVCHALRKRDMSALFRLLQQYLGLSQIRIGTAVGLGQGRMSEVINGIRASATPTSSSASPTASTCPTTPGSCWG